MAALLLGSICSHLDMLDCHAFREQRQRIPVIAGFFHFAFLKESVQFHVYYEYVAAEALVQYYARIVSRYSWERSPCSETISRVTRNQSMRGRGLL